MSDALASSRLSQPGSPGRTCEWRHSLESLRARTACGRQPLSVERTLRRGRLAGRTRPSVQGGWPPAPRCAAPLARTFNGAPANGAPRCGAPLHGPTPERSPLVRGRDHPRDPRPGVLRQPPAPFRSPLDHDAEPAHGLPMQVSAVEWDPAREPQPLRGARAVPPSRGRRGPSGALPPHPSPGARSRGGRRVATALPRPYLRGQIPGGGRGAPTRGRHASDHLLAVVREVREPL